MKRIAILTTHRANNFGAMLQAYSLVTYLREQGAEAEIFDYRTPLFEKQYHTGWRFGRNPIRTLKYLYWYWHDERNARRKFEEFRKTLPMSRPYPSRRSLLNAEKEYDVFIVGSDQVWKPAQTAPQNPIHFDRTYLLDFVNEKRKYAYADSIGVSTIQPESLIPEYDAAWRAFDGISMREKMGAQFVDGCIGKVIPTVVDPVFLHDCGFWRNIMSRLLLPERYVIVYNVQHYRKESLWMVGQAREFAERIGAKVLNILVPSAPGSRMGGCDLSVGPREFLSLIEGAMAVFTNSFHATAFSILFKKQLFLHSADAYGNANTRFDFLRSVAKMGVVQRARNGVDEITVIDCRSIKFDVLDAEIVASRRLLDSWIANG